MEVKFMRLDACAEIPSYAKYGDAGLDLTAISMECIDGGYIYGTGLAVEIPDGYVGLIFPRSSVYKKRLSLANCVGVVDSGYRGEIKFIFREHQYDVGTLYRVGDRVGQMIIMPFPSIEPIEVSSLSRSDRGAGSFGSTGF